MVLRLAAFEHGPRGIQAEFLLRLDLLAVLHVGRLVTFQTSGLDQGQDFLLEIDCALRGHGGKDKSERECSQEKRARCHGGVGNACCPRLFQEKSPPCPQAPLSADPKPKPCSTGTHSGSSWG